MTTSGLLIRFLLRATVASDYEEDAFAQPIIGRTLRGSAEVACRVERELIHWPDAAAEVIRNLFGNARALCDLNGDGRTSAADLISAGRLLRPPSTTSPSPSATATASPSPTPTPTEALRFVDVTAEAGLGHTPFEVLSGGVAAGDYDGDGDPDLYMTRIDKGPSLLFRNRGDGTFEDVGAAAGVALTGIHGASPIFADVDGDGWLDLFVQGAVGNSTRLYRNRGDGTFDDASARARIATAYDTLPADMPCDGCDSPGGPAWGDYDRDGDLDLFLTHLETPIPAEGVQNLWRNEGDGTFTDVTADAGVVGLLVDRGKGLSSYMYTPNFADIDNDGWPDLLVVSDWGMSRVYVNNRDGTFTDRTDAAITDENGMGAAVGDYDEDGNLDWFVSSVWDPSGDSLGLYGVSGNRLYRGRGDGSFEDATEDAGVRAGYWGWGSCFADFDNDRDLDIFHVNGSGVFIYYDFNFDPTRLFLSNGDGTFAESSVELGIDDRAFGHGVVCFDHDLDGDIDLLIQNRLQPPRLYRNEGGNRKNFLAVKLHGRAPNSEAVGARVQLTVGGRTQLRELSAGSNFMSQNPAVAHFGLGDAAQADMLVVWPDRKTTLLERVAANQFLSVTEP